MSAKSITEIVNEGLSEVSRGKNYVEETAKALNVIINLIASMEGLVQKITESAKYQSKASEVVLADMQKLMEMADIISSSTNEQMLSNIEMTKTMEQINRKTQDTAASAEEIASSAEDMTKRRNYSSRSFHFLNYDGSTNELVVIYAMTLKYFIDFKLSLTEIILVFLALFLIKS